METTLNMPIDVLGQISKAAMAKGITRSEMIVILLKKMMDDTGCADTLWKMVQYQGRRRPDEWHKFHLVVRPDDYEYFLDLRKLLKMSVSLILTIAVKKYLRTLLIKFPTDNYRYKDYVIIKEFIGNIPCWKFIWGYPPDIEKHI